MKIEQPVYFYQASYDSRSKNLVLVDADKPVFTAGPLDNDGVLKLLGNELGGKLLSTAAPADSGWEFQIEGSWQLWQRENGSVVSILVAEDGSDGPFRAHAYNDAQGTQLFIDVQKADAEQGDVSLALCVMSNSDGMPSVVIHDADGTWVTTAELRHDGRVELLPGNYEPAQFAGPPGSCIVVLGAHANDDHGVGPSYASFKLDAEFLKRLTDLQNLCQAHGLSEARVASGPDWEDEASFHLQDGELVMTASGSCWFVDRPKHCSYSIETRGFDLADLRKRVQSGWPATPVFLTDDREVVQKYEEDQADSPDA